MSSDNDGRVDRGRRIREKREEKSLSKAEVARELGMPYSTYDGYEKGYREPSIEVYEQIANVLGADAHYLLTGITSDSVRFIKDLATARVNAVFAAYYGYGYSHVYHEDDGSVVITNPKGEEVALSRKDFSSYSDFLVCELGGHLDLLHSTALRAVRHSEGVTTDAQQEK